MFSLKTRRLLRWLLPAAALLTAAAVLAALFFTGVLKLNTPSRERYPVRGVDVSSWQGEIDWPTLAGQGLSFAFIKATEGSGFTDPRFSYNWEEARKTALRVGAYHFFSYDSPGKTQADNFIAAVPREPGALPPVVDVEFYGDKAADPPAAADVHPQLDALGSAVWKPITAFAPSCTPPGKPTASTWRAGMTITTSGSGTFISPPACRHPAPGPSGSTRTTPGCRAIPAGSPVST